MRLKAKLLSLLFAAAAALIAGAVGVASAPGASHAAVVGPAPGDA